jgi:hypothetical protein
MVKMILDLMMEVRYLSASYSITIVGDSVIPSTPNGKNDTRSDDGGKTFIC